MTKVWACRRYDRRNYWHKWEPGSLSLSPEWRRDYSMERCSRVWPNYSRHRTGTSASAALPSSWHCTAREPEGFPGHAGVEVDGAVGVPPLLVAHHARPPQLVSPWPPIIIKTMPAACPPHPFFSPTTRDNPDFIHENEITEYMVKHQSMDLFGGAKIKC